MKNHALARASMAIPYHAQFTKYTKNPIATLLMQQLEYWFSKYSNGFYKIIGKGNKNEKDSEDSWCTELQISYFKFNRAFQSIGKIYKSKTEYDNSPDKFQGKPYLLYHDKKNERPVFLRNHEIADDLINKIFVQSPILPEEESECCDLNDSNHVIQETQITCFNKLESRDSINLNHSIGTENTNREIILSDDNIIPKVDFTLESELNFIFNLWNQSAKVANARKHFKPPKGLKKKIKDFKTFAPDIDFEKYFLELLNQSFVKTEIDSCFKTLEWALRQNTYEQWNAGLYQKMPDILKSNKNQLPKNFEEVDYGKDRGLDG